MNKQSYHHGNLRSVLIEKAIQVIEKDGPEKINLRDLSLSAGVSRTAPYRHFKSKSHLLTAVACRGFAMLEVACSNVLPGDPEERLIKLCRGYLDFAFTNPGLYGVMFAPERYHNPVQDELRSASDNAFLKLETILMEFPGDKPAELNAGAVWAMVHGLAIIINQNLVRVIGHGRPESTAIQTGILDKEMRLQVDHALEVLAAGLSSHYQLKRGGENI